MANDSVQAEQLSPLQRSFLLIETLEAKIERLQYAKREPIAIVGMGCRFPGGVDNPASFWQLLRQGGDGVTEIPATRWDIDKYYDPDPDVPGKMYSRSGGFLEQVEQFDPQFFGISPREAVSIDPQHRLLLEVAWEALENAGYPVERDQGSSTGVFVGITLDDYGLIGKQAQAELQTQSPSVANPQFEIHGVTGSPSYAAAGRISYTFGFTGPAMAIDTACSSSLVAIHQACQSLRQQECEMALAGGVNLILLPDSMIATSKAKMLSFDGRCKTFDAVADGIGRGEGCGILVLKRLSDAQANGDRILATIRGSAVNQDGPSSGLTVPSGISQQAVMRQALKQAKLDPADISYVEAHGTGTPLGDPIELRSLAKVYGPGHSPESPLYISSAKTNISHVESAAGVAGVMRVILQLQHREIAPHLHLKTPTEHFNWQDVSVVVPDTVVPWEVQSGSRIGVVNSFGATGTNAHVIVQEAPQSVNTSPSPESSALPERSLHLLTLSAKSEAALKALANRYRQHLEHCQDSDLADICYSANTGRTPFKYRFALIASNLSDLGAQLDLLTTSEALELEPKFNVATPGLFPKVAFLFSGQGDHSVNMGRQLYETQPLFREILDNCDAILRSELKQPLIEILYPNSEIEPSDSEVKGLDQATDVQSALFALEYALAQLWIAWGIKPKVVMGHSLGEYVAACVAGVFSLEDGLKLVTERARLMQALPAGGVMVSLRCSVEQAKSVIDGQGVSHQVSVAAINGPASTVIAGSDFAVQTVVTQLEGDGITTKYLQVSHAFHSVLMQPMLANFEAVARQVTYSLPQTKLISCVTGQAITSEIATPEYWCRHILAPVNFAAGMETLSQEGCEVLVECGPKPTLLGMGRQCLSVDKGTWLPSLRPGYSDWQQMLTSLSELYLKGFTIDWVSFERDYPQRNQVTLPTYPFQRKPYWFDLPESVDAVPANGALNQSEQSPETTVSSPSSISGQTIPQEDTSKLPQENSIGELQLTESVGLSNNGWIAPPDQALETPLERLINQQIQTMSQLISQQLDVLKSQSVYQDSSEESPAFPTSESFPPTSSPLRPSMHN